MTLDQAIQRLVKMLPRSWWNNNALKIGGETYALLTVMSNEILAARDQIDYVALQTRLLTATDTNLDAKVSDYLGKTSTRALVLDSAGITLVPETDAQYSLRAQGDIITPRPTLAGMKIRVTEYIQTYYTAEIVSNALLIGAGTAGGLDTVGGLDGRPKDTPPLPIVDVFDLQSDPVRSAQVPLTDGQFCILLTYGGVETDGFFLTKPGYTRRTHLGRGSHLLNPNFQVIPAPTPTLDAIVEQNKVMGTQQVYVDNRTV